MKNISALFWDITQRVAARDYYHSLCSNPDERRYLLRGGSLESRMHVDV